MAFPAIQKFTAAGMIVNQQITFVSLLTTLGTYITGITNQAIAQGYVCAGSSNGVTAAMDGTNRCTTAAGFAVRNSSLTAAQSWIVITAANGAQTLFTFNGASDDVCRISGSPAGLFVVAGTATFAPTATDEVVAITGTTIIGTTNSGNRIYNVQIDSAHNGWRAFVFSAGVLAAAVLYGELFDPAFIVGPGATCAVPTWWGATSPTNINTGGNFFSSYSANTLGGSTRMIVGGTARTINMGASAKCTSGLFTNENNVVQDLNGGLFTFRTVGLHSITTNGKGDVGRRFDWLYTNEFKACGELDSTKNWAVLSLQSVAGGSSGMMWTWDGSTASVQTS